MVFYLRAHSKDRASLPIERGWTPVPSTRNSLVVSESGVDRVADYETGSLGGGKRVIKLCGPPWVAGDRDRYRLVQLNICKHCSDGTGGNLFIGGTRSTDRYNCVSLALGQKREQSILRNLLHRREKGFYERGTL